jgi:serine/threonine-protein kinase PBS1
VATGYFNEANFIGEGGFGKVYKGKINGQVSKTSAFFPRQFSWLKIWQYRDRRLPMHFFSLVCKWWQWSSSLETLETEFLVEVLMLTVLNHRNLVSLVGFYAWTRGCCLLVYEYMPFGSLESHLFGKLFIL